METWTEIMDEFLDLNNVDLEQIDYKELKDEYLEVCILLRRWQRSWTIYFLYSSDEIKIPIEWFLLFDALNVSHGERLNWIKDSDRSVKTKVDQFIKSWWMFLCTKELQYIESILNHGTKRVREYLMERGINLDPWKYENNDKKIIV